MLIHPNTGTISLTDSYLSGFFYSLNYEMEIHSHTPSGKNSAWFE
jgi:hypothetical protein